MACSLGPAGGRGKLGAPLACTAIQLLRAANIPYCSRRRYSQAQRLYTTEKFERNRPQFAIEYRCQISHWPLLFFVKLFVWQQAPLLPVVHHHQHFIFVALLIVAITYSHRWRNSPKGRLRVHASSRGALNTYCRHEMWESLRPTSEASDCNPQRPPAHSCLMCIASSVDDTMQ